ncbi:hypothetical protein TRFO_14278 [Tritrichomonas foetus]|uniref:Pecanex C-terminal domain-containing protein n=1 Tax=Tritrichomonas foetus TaxID=1144522 RepID=A0A1J4KVR8_9EUKA|nr:hypothetical protein TRFO_14278 [Tritrichomonas foetus]|eukprot:OHT15242.1 hypothetical protein TRFO_14278 [Tritrichomonas foetus]
MTRTVKNVFLTFLGGLSISSKNLIPPLIIFVCLVAFFETLFFVQISKTEKLIASGVLMGVILLFKLIFYVLAILARHAVDLSESNHELEEKPPEQFPQEIWNLKPLLLNENSSIDSVVGDLIASGYDANMIFEFVEYLNSNQPTIDVKTNENSEGQLSVINCCGRLIDLSFNQKHIEIVFPINHTFFYIILSTVFGFSATYLPLLFKDEFSTAAKVFIAFNCATSIFSIIKPPEAEPYSQKLMDIWNGCTRPLHISLLLSLYKVLKIIEENYNNVTKLPIYDWEIDWSLISPYLRDIILYTLILFPIFILIGYIGHPISTVISMIESFNRYAFGQSGVANVWHMIIQVLRGSVAVAIVWAIFEHTKNDSKIYFCAALTIATFINTLPIIWSRPIREKWVLAVSMPLVLSAFSFFMSYVFTTIIKNNWKIIQWVCFGWFLLVDVIFPLFYSCNLHVYILHMRIFHGIPQFILYIVHALSFAVFVPLFISSALADYSLNKDLDQGIIIGGSSNDRNSYFDVNFILLAFILVHANQRAYSSPVTFALAVFITVVTCNYDFGLKNSAFNLGISLLIITKLEVFYPTVQSILRMRDFTNTILYCLGDLIEDVQDYLFPITGSILQEMPLVDFVMKVPTLIWCFFTGSNFSSPFGVAFFTLPSPIRPFYFFEASHTDTTDLSRVFTKKVTEHPAEIPAYTSVCRALSKEFSSIVMTGKLGHAVPGDIFLFISDNLTCLVYIISAEPGLMKIQLRGLEYNSTTACHDGERSILSDIMTLYTDHDFFNIDAARCAYFGSYDLRATDIPLKMYDVQSIPIAQAFVGIPTNAQKMWFLVAYCHYIVKGTLNAEDIRFIPDEIAEHYEESLPDKYNEIFDFSMRMAHVEISEEYKRQYLMLYVVLQQAVFSSEGNLNLPVLHEVVRGNIAIPDDAMWLYDSQLMSSFVIPIVKLSFGLMFMASSQACDDITSEDTMMEFCIHYVKEFQNENLMTTVDSEDFRKEFEIEKKTILAIENVQNKTTLLRFNNSMKHWDVFQLRREWVKALWTNEQRDILFYQQSQRERTSIQMNTYWLNNLLVQSCDSPVGYPAYVSQILDSFVYPSTNVYEV